MKKYFSINVLYVFIMLSVSSLLRAQLVETCSDMATLKLAEGCKIESQIDYHGYSSAIVKAYPAFDSELSLKQTLVMVSGYDPQGDIGFEYYMDKLNENGLVANQLRSQGVDIIVLNFGADSRDYIQNNAFVLVELLRLLDQLSVDDKSVVVLGWSLGGVISQYALGYMESNGISHNVRNSISFDSPHRGANIPVSLQRTLTFLKQASERALDEAEDANSLVTFLSLAAFFDQMHPGLGIFLGQHTNDLVGSTKDSVEAISLLNDELLDSPAAKQLLINHHAFNGSHPERIQFLTELQNYKMSLSSNVRTVAFTNGSVTADMLSGYELGQKVSYFDYRNPDPVDDVTIDIAAYNTVDIKTISCHAVTALHDNDSFSCNNAQRVINGSGITYICDCDGSGSIPSGKFSCPAQWCPVNQENIIEATMIGPHAPNPLKPWEGIEIKAYQTENSGPSNGHLELDGVAGGYEDTVKVFVEKFNESLDSRFPEMELGLENFSFIPTVSALDIELNKININLIDLAANGNVASLTPFDAVYYPKVTANDDNQKHLTVTTQHANDLYREITVKHDISWLTTVINYLLDEN